MPILLCGPVIQSKVSIYIYINKFKKTPNKYILVDSSPHNPELRKNN